MLDIFRGKGLHDLDLSDVATLLDDVEAEPLHWEAKGVAINAGEVRKQICGFANSHDGGFLILGTHVADDVWKLDGVEFANDDPPAWISEVAEGVQPPPEGLDTQPISVTDRWVAVVWIPPTPTPPCNAHGTIYERVSGRTVSVRDPLRLSQLFGRGEVAHETATREARFAAERSLALGGSVWASPDVNVTFSLGLRAVAYEDQIKERLFGTEMSDLLTKMVPGEIGSFGRDVVVEHRQNAVLAYTARPPVNLGGGEWVVHAAWDGSVGVAYRLFNLEKVGRLRDLVQLEVRKAWEMAASVMELLRPRGPAYLQIILEGQQFRPRIAEPEILTGALRRGPWRPGQIDRGPIGFHVDDEVLSGIEREVLRLEGYEHVPEPEPRAGAN